jgi:OmpA-OmpF porin, OOP family
MKIRNVKPRKLSFLLPLCLFSVGVFAQNAENLVQNGSFESTDGKVKKLGSIESALGWSSPTGARADLFTPSTKIPDINVPDNIMGKENAKEGQNYAGIHAFSFGDKVPRTYLTSKLTTPLKKGMRYCVKFNISLAETSKYSSNQVGVNFSSKPYSTDSKISIIENTHVLQAENKIFNAMYNWDQVCGVFEAEGGEKYITIGNFTSNEDTKSEKNRKPADLKGSQVISAYYYIDNIEVILLGEGDVCDCIAGGSDDEVFSATIYQKSFRVDENMTSKDIIELQELYFAFGKKKLSQAGMESLELVKDLMLKNPAYKIEITGHNNEKEDKVAEENDYYLNMDEQRIQIVVDYLQQNGIEEPRIITVAKDSTEPNSEISESDSKDISLAKSRRVTFRILE